MLCRHRITVIGSIIACSLEILWHLYSVYLPVLDGLCFHFWFHHLSWHGFGSESCSSTEFCNLDPNSSISAGSQPDISSLPAAASLEGSSVDEPPLLELSGAAELEKVGMNRSSATEESSNALLHEFSHVKSGVEEKSFEEKFNALSEKIDAFDPVSLFEDSDVAPSQGEVIESESSSLFSKDINDESLIDDLIKDSEIESRNSDETEGGSKGDKSGTVANGSDEIKLGEECSDRRELGKENKASESDSVGGNSDNKIVNDVQKERFNDLVDNEVSISTVEGIDNGLEAETNGELIVSTESEGGNEDQNNGESGETVESKTVTDGGNENKEPNNSGEKKTESGKTETTSSPTKSAKPKKKEDKSIGKCHLISFMQIVFFRKFPDILKI